MARRTSRAERAAASSRVLFTFFRNFSARLGAFSTGRSRRIFSARLRQSPQLSRCASTSRVVSASVRSSR